MSSYFFGGLRALAVQKFVWYGRHRVPFISFFNQVRDDVEVVLTSFSWSGRVPPRG